MKNLPIHILLANDNKTLRKGIRLAFKEFAPHIQIVEEVDSFQDLLAKIDHTEFDILMSDDIMHGENILTYLPGLKEQYPNLKIILNSIFTEEVLHLEKAKELTKGWISFASQPEDYVEAIETVYAGNYYNFKGLNTEDLI